MAKATLERSISRTLSYSCPLPIFHIKYAPLIQQTRANPSIQITFLVIANKCRSFSYLGPPKNIFCYAVGIEKSWGNFFNFIFFLIIFVINQDWNFFFLLVNVKKSDFVIEKILEFLFSIHMLKRRLSCR